MAGLKREIKEIDGHKVEVTTFMAVDGLLMKGRLLLILGPALSNAIKGIKSKEGKSAFNLSGIMDVDLDMTVLGDALKDLIYKIADPAVVKLIIDLLEYTQYDGKALTKDVINMEFAGEYMTLYKVLFFVVEANRFFGKRNIGDLLKENIQSNLSKTQNDIPQDSIKK